MFVVTRPSPSWERSKASFIDRQPPPKLVDCGQAPKERTQYPQSWKKTLRFVLAPLRLLAEVSFWCGLCVAVGSLFLACEWQANKERVTFTCNMPNLSKALRAWSCPTFNCRSLSTNYAAVEYAMQCDELKKAYHRAQMEVHSDKLRIEYPSCDLFSLERCSVKLNSLMEVRNVQLQCKVT
eukprot:GEMP01049145.1.p1 GENE.GEMP01049145.1~~GEMP01049145.1.p1  ORF type:complete len:181 (+),score=27.73 GEMP01049145.1:322-864(+)